MNMSLTTLIKATALGVATKYMYDPVQERRRRALLRDKCVRIRKAVQDTAGVMLRDLKNRARGTVAEGRAAFLEDRVRVDDAVLRERVRSILTTVRALWKRLAKPSMNQWRRLKNKRDELWKKQERP